MIWRTSISASVLVLAALSGCAPSYSPDTYAANAAQPANKVDQGVVVGVRNVGISAAGTVGTVTGAAAGGIAGSQAVPAPASALTALGGALVGGIAGAAVEHATSDTTAYEYIVRKTAGDLVSVTQKDKTPLVLGERVLVIAGSQARVVPDYTDPTLDPPAKAAAIAKVADAVKAADAASKPGDGKPPGATPGAAASITPLPAGAASPAAAEAPAGVPAVAAPVAAALTGGSAAVPSPTVLVPSSPQASTAGASAAQSATITPTASAPAAIVATPLSPAAPQSAASAKPSGGTTQ
ncbi:MAG TPA: hypothetical protein VGF36_11155 [Rhodopila sp.]